MVGSAGSGKTMLAKRIPTILPQLSAGESIDEMHLAEAIGYRSLDRDLWV